MRTVTHIAVAVIGLTLNGQPSREVSPRVEFSEMTQIVKQAIRVALDDYDASPTAPKNRQIVTDFAESLRRLKAATVQTQPGSPMTDSDQDKRAKSASFLDHFTCRDSESRKDCTISSDVVYVGVMKVDAVRDDGLLAVWIDRRWRNRPSSPTGSSGSVLQLLFKKSNTGTWEFAKIGARIAAQGS